MTLTTSGSRSTAARPRTRPATTSRPARAAESRPAAGGAPARRPSASSPARGSSASRTTCCSASARPPTAPSWQAAGQRPQSRRPVREAAGRRAARHRRTPARTADRSHQAGPAEPAVLRPDDLAVQVDLDLPRLPRRERPPGPPGRRQRRRPVLVRPGHRGRRHDLAGRARRVRLLPARGGLHPHRLPQHPGARPGDRPVARGRPGRSALAAAHLPGRRHAAACPLPDRPRRPHRHRREMACPGLPGLQRAHRRRRRDRLPAPGRSPHRPVRPGMDRPRRRPRLRDQGHLRGDDARVLLAPRVDHRRPAHARRAIRAAVRTQAVPARARAARASLELHNARGQGRRAGFRAAARGLGGQARAHPRRLTGVGRAVGLARRRPRRRARARPGLTSPAFRPNSSRPARRRKRSRWRSRKRAPGPART